MNRSEISETSLMAAPGFSPSPMADLQASPIFCMLSSQVCQTFEYPSNQFFEKFTNSSGATVGAEPAGAAVNIFCHLAKASSQVSFPGTCPAPNILKGCVYISNRSL